MAGLEDMELSLVTFNIGCEGESDKRKKIIDRFLKDRVKHLPSLLYFQENPWRGFNIKNHVEAIKESDYGVVYNYNDMHLRCEPDASVFYRKDVLKVEESLEWMELFKKAFNDAKTLTFPTFEKRASYSKLTETKTRKSFFAISWHGEHTGKSIDEKIKIFKDLLMVILYVRENYSKTEKLPVVLGGDFNINIAPDTRDTRDKVLDSIMEAGLVVYDHEPNENRKRVIDFFVVTPDVKLSGLSALGKYMYAEKNSVPDKEGESPRQSSAHSSPEEPKKVFDHFPVQAMVAFVVDDDHDDIIRKIKAVSLENPQNPTR